VILRDGFLPSDNDYDCLGTGVDARKTANTSDGYGLVAGLFAVYQDRAEKYRFRLKTSNGQVVATGEGTRPSPRRSGLRVRATGS